MPHKDSTHPAWANDALLRLVRILASCLMIGMGASILVTGYAKLAANPYFANLLSWGPWWLWGIAPITFGALSLFRSHRLQLAGYAASSAYLWLWWAATTSAVFAHGAKVAYTGIPPWTILALLLTSLTVVSITERRGQR